MLKTIQNSYPNLPKKSSELSQLTNSDVHIFVQRILILQISMTLLMCNSRLVLNHCPKKEREMKRKGRRKTKHFVVILIPQPDPRQITHVSVRYKTQKLKLCWVKLRSCFWRIGVIMGPFFLLAFPLILTTVLAGNVLIGCISTEHGFCRKPPKLMPSGNAPLNISMCRNI